MITNIINPLQTVVNRDFRKRVNDILLRPINGNENQLDGSMKKTDDSINDLLREPSGKEKIIIKMSGNVSPRCENEFLKNKMIKRMSTKTYFNKKEMKSIIDFFRRKKNDL